MFSAFDSKFAVHYPLWSLFLHISATVVLTQENFCYLSHLLGYTGLTGWDGLRATSFEFTGTAEGHEIDTTISSAESVEKPDSLYRLAITSRTSAVPNSVPVRMFAPTDLSDAPKSLWPE